MALLNIRKFPDPALKDPAQPVANIDGGLASFIESMVQTMYAAPGVGLAAPQVGDSRRVVVLDTDHQNPGKKLLRLINPKVVEAAGSVIWEEGCLSVVDYTADVKRAARVLVRAWTPEEKEIEIERTTCSRSPCSTRSTTSTASCLSIASAVSSANCTGVNSPSC